MMEVGGVYLDTDTAVLKKFDELRKKEMILAEEEPDVLGWLVKMPYSVYITFITIYPIARTPVFKTLSLMNTLVIIHL